MAADGEALVLTPESMRRWAPSKTFVPRTPPDSAPEARELQWFAGAAMSGTGERAVVSTTDGQLHAIHPAGGYLQALHRNEAFGVRAMTFTHHSASIVYAAGKSIGTRSGTIVQHRLHDNTATRMHSAHGETRVVCVSVCPTRDIFASTDEAGNVMLWHMGACNAVATTRVGSSANLTCFDATGTVFVVAGPDCGVALYSVASFMMGPFKTSAAPAALLRKRVRAAIVPAGSDRGAASAAAAGADSGSAGPASSSARGGGSVEEHDERWTHLACSPDGKILALTTSLGAVHLLNAFDLTILADVPEHTEIPAGAAGAAAGAAGGAEAAAGTGPAAATPTVLGRPDGTAMAASAFSPCGSCLVRPTACGRPEAIFLGAFASMEAGKPFDRVDAGKLPRALLGEAAGGSDESRHADPIIGVVMHPTRALVLSFSAKAAALWTPPPIHKSVGTAGKAAGEGGAAATAGAGTAAATAKPSA